MKFALIAAVAGALLSVTPAFAGELEDRNTAVVVGFLETAFNRHDVPGAIDQYFGPAYIQHNPNVADGRDAALRGLSRLVANNPQLTISIKRTIAQGDLVAAHFHQVRQPGERGKAIVDIFRLENGRIVEHWDVIEEVPEAPVNPNGMF